MSYFAEATKDTPRSLERRGVAKKIIQTGNSAAVTLPSEFLKVLNIKVGDPVEVTVNYVKGEIVFRFPSARQLPLAVERR